MISCEKNPVDTIDIFITEELTDPVRIEMGIDEGLDKLMVNAGRIIETPSGYHIKGTIFSETFSGTLPVTSGDFTIKTNLAAGSSGKGSGAMDFSGYGTASFPEAGLFSVSEIDEIPGSEVYYNTGRYFKSGSNTEIPLLDDRYYFRYRLDKAGNGKEFRMKKIVLKLKEYYLDGRDPSAIFTGDVYTEKAGQKRLLVEKGVTGISSNELFEFVPYVYGSNLEAVTGGTGFENMNGGVFFSGLIPIKQYPVKILGRGVINTSFSSAGPLDFFERGFDEASFEMGVNGKLFFSNELVSFLTGTDTVSLGKATLQAEFSDEGFGIKIAGEYSDNILERFLGETMMSFIPHNSGEGVMYLRGSGDPDDLIVYLEENVSLNIPGLGTTPLANSTFRITRDEVGLSGSVQLPYNIGNVEVTGVVRSDGSFLLNGLTNCNIDLGGGLVYNADLQVELSQVGVSLRGAMSFPYGIGNVAVTGGILSDEVYFTGRIASLIPFPVNSGIESDLDVSISSRTGISLAGDLSLPGGIGDIGVTGILNTDGLMLTGIIDAGVDINFGNVDLNTGTTLSLTASSLTGVVMTGSVYLPFSLGNADVNIRVTPDGLSLSGDMGSHINISGYPLFNTDMSISASTSGGLRLSGRMLFPGNFGWVSVSGYVANSGYSLTGNIGSSSIDFEIVRLSTDFSMSITDHSGIRTSASGEGCVDLVVEDVCADVGVDVNINYYSGSVELCMSFPVVGSACIGW